MTTVSYLDDLFEELQAAQKTLFAVAKEHARLKQAHDNYYRSGEAELMHIRVRLASRRVRELEDEIFQEQEAQKRKKQHDESKNP